MQTYFAKKAATFLSKELHTTVSLKGMYFKPFSSLVLNGLYIADLKGDTLLYAQQLSASVNLRKLHDAQVVVSHLKLTDSRFFLKRHADSTNLSFILNYFRPEPPDKSPSTKGIKLDIRAIDLSNISFQYKADKNGSNAKGIDFKDVQITELSGSFADIDFDNHVFKSTIKNLRFKEKSGFHLREMNALTVVDTNSTELQNLYIETNRSRLRNFLRFEYDDLSAFGDFIENVNIGLNLDRAQIHSKDIEYFAPGIAKTNFDVAISGEFTGKIPAITARRVAIRLGGSTRLQGNFTIKGLPDIHHTIFDLQLRHLVTNSHEIESLVPQLGNTPELKLPDVFDRMGNITYQGGLTGHYNDFIANGTFETALGMLKTDINLQLNDENRYSGHLSSGDFDLGVLLQQELVGHGGFDVTVEGQGFALHNIDSKVMGNIEYLDFKGYRYNNIDLEGRFAEMLFAGNLAVNDPNLQLLFDGEVNLNPQWPEYTFIAEVGHAHLRNIHVYESALVIVQEATVTSNFKGNTLNNIQGEVALHDVRFQADTNSFTIDSLALVATGNEEHRTLWLTSDLVDATVNGEMDLNTFGAYFKSVAMHYAPSMGLESNPYGKQAFDFNLKLKDFAPIAVFLAPKLALPEGALMNGHFSTTSNLANFNFLAPKLTFGSLSINRLIVDETANGGALRLFITADRISITDSLYINNLNLSNVLANDSLQFNLKLSNVSANNQLDLNGLVNFTKGEPAKMSILPSSVVLNRESWQLDERASLYFDEGKIHMHGLELSRRDQTVQLGGIISSNDEDKAFLTFKNFNLSTLNSVTQPSGIGLRGMLNGRMDVSSVLKTPYAIADIEAEDVHLNNTEIGDMLLQADFDRPSRLVNVKLEVARGDVKTIMATGTYNATAETDKLNMEAKLNRSELIIFQPFLSNLVSDISGTLSANLNITGSVLTPQINGICFLHDAGFTVNYLKTPYRIDDDISLSNSTIIFEDLVITDPNNNRALANGKVDMRNPSIPDIDAVVDATNFLILNTTFRDNPLYYGTAYSTGKFSFKGPTNAISIDIKARTNENTNFNIPLNAVGTVNDNDFIRFVSHDTLDALRPRSRFLKGLSMNMDLQITPEAAMNLYTDLGELSGRGEGLISLRISSLGDFEMFGDYTINTGKFTFTAQDFINKIFDINEGGTIRWTGQPTEAIVNLTAVYGQRISMAPLYNAAGRETVEQRLLAQAEMNLNGNLMRPDITFGLNFPNDPYVKDELQSYLSDANNVNQQALSLIVRRSFAPGSASDFSRELNNTLLSAGTELAFNQLNNLISQSLNLNFVDLNIRSLNDASASVRLFNDRLVFTGGVTDRRNLNDLSIFSDRIVTDAELLYLIRKDGRLVLRGSNRLNSRNSLLVPLNDNYVSALGLVYRQEFYTFSEFFRRLVTIRNKAEEEKERDEEDDVKR
ncbi:translocation/assembly module TamB domain-containing protein [Parapedobacter tibetensis]|uniref:translocation/assembly module TamB domain-containing protein n=1 Tax=Parapedobacter tibetensis TaxID=2972951 RepID=UPI00214DC22A|nr:translocation/assembly module TamB domain-containing protein [Parapedobacter tibetensis]